MIKDVIGKHEIPHIILDNVRLDGIKSGNDNWKLSGRFSAYIGYIHKKGKQTFKLVDKIINEINVCPCCKSKATYHHRIQQTGDQIDNVWQTRKIESKDGYCFIKQDLCLDCGNVFMIEAYMWHKVKRK